jgi:hypothetical protein
LFGGYDALGSGWLGDTWTISGDSWTQLFPAATPDARSSAAAAYDPGLSGVLVFGGYDYYNANPYDNDTWLFSDGNWTQLFPPASPSVRSEASMAYDPALAELVLFGGTDGTSLLNDTWAYAGGGWNRLSTPVAPPELSGASMTYDANTSSLVLYGGALSSGDSSATWSFNGDWTPLHIPGSPGGQYLPMMAQLPNGTVLLATDSNANSSSAPIIVWELSGTGWTPIATTQGPGSRVGGGMTFDSTDGYPLLFGGRLPAEDAGGPSLNDTWAFDTLTGRILPASPRGIAPFALNLSASTVGGTRHSNGSSSLTYLWSLGDGTTSTASSPTHTYDVTGILPIDLVLRDGFGLSLSLAANVSVGFLLTLTVTNVDNLSLEYQFMAAAPYSASPLSYLWSFGDGTPASFTPEPTHNYSAPGSYTVELQAKDRNGAIAWANDTFTASATPLPSRTPGPNTSSGPGTTFHSIEEYGAVGAVIVVVVVAGVLLWRRRAGPPPDR